MVTFGILDYAQIDEGSNAKQALEHSVEMAQFAESLGFDRFWVAEHHNVPAFASSSPELLMMRIADATKRIRIGSGGVMIPHYSPFKVAENFRMLESFHPNRIDLGIGNNKGTHIVNQVLNEGKETMLSYEQSVIDVTNYLSNQSSGTERFSGITAQPVISTIPQAWLLSNSVRSATIAAKLGLGYTYGFFLAGMDRITTGIEAVEIYRKTFTPSPFMPEPKVSLAPIVVVAETNEEAKEYQEALDVWLLGKDNYSYFNQFPSVETARNYTCTEKEKAIIQANRQKMIVGDLSSVTEQIHSLMTTFHADEVLFIPLMPGFNVRKKAIKLLATIFK